MSQEDFEKAVKYVNKGKKYSRFSSSLIINQGPPIDGITNEMRLKFYGYPSTLIQFLTHHQDFINKQQLENAIKNNLPDSHQSKE